MCYSLCAATKSFLAVVACNFVMYEGEECDECGGEIDNCGGYDSAGDAYCEDCWLNYFNACCQSETAPSGKVEGWCAECGAAVYQSELIHSSLGQSHFKNGCPIYDEDDEM